MYNKKAEQRVSSILTLPTFLAVALRRATNFHLSSLILKLQSNTITHHTLPHFITPYFILTYTLILTLYTLTNTLSHTKKLHTITHYYLLTTHYRV